MTGVDIIGALLGADAALAAIVPPERIRAGELPESFQLPAIVVRMVSSVDRQPLVHGGTTRSRDRISATVRAASYDVQTEVIRLIRAACAGRRGDIAGAVAVSVLTAGLGPDLKGPGNTFEQGQDFSVSYDA